jgi:hypothetical protein
MKRNAQKGFIALISAVIMSAVLLIVVVSGSLSSFFGRQDVLDAEYKEKSRALADACISVLLLRIGAGTTPSDPVTEVSCTISGSANPYTISATFNRAETNLSVSVDSSLAITSLTEVP